MSDSAAPDRPLDLVIFGGAGDLSVRKLLPALFAAHRHGHLPAQARIVVLGRQPWDRGGFLDFIQDKVAGFVGADGRQSGHWTGFLERLQHATLDATRAEDFTALGRQLRPGADRVFYWPPRPPCSPTSVPTSTPPG